MPLPSSSSTNVGGGGRSPGKSFSPRGSGGGATVRQRRATPNARSKGSGGTAASTAGSTMWRFYNEDSPGLKVGPVPVLVMSLLFIASVFMLHIWGKYTRGG
ncbi:protein transport protein Sec61 subunit beta-like [Styela clava]|uniref:protein transport protein Sec61 subunit beta-like n=1 Tax=Styela clava TaxID=7725 RepID=UPI00193A0BC0|nr:protein transport protein Sec61 subunit beta-like [Styela clava]XP_039252942.1 protein transport protein Sec61 subunit beta-like [Styela clava]